MTDAEKMIFELDAIRRERAAFIEGATEYTSRLIAERDAKRRYPLPRKTVPRVVTMPNRFGADWHYRIVGGVLQRQSALADCCPHDVRWEDATTTVENCRALLDLFARPTEEVSADA